MRNRLKAPFPAFGGKSRVAALVWERLGDVDNFIEPFANSAAVLLARPHPPRVETLNDLDCYVANFWRATQHDPGGVAEYADGPVNEADLHARHRWLVGIDPRGPWTDTPYLHAMAGPGKWAAERRAFRQRVRTDPDYYDVRVAGWWCWGACCWIGGGWCATPETGPVHGPVGGSGERLPDFGGRSGSNRGVCGKGTVAHEQRRPLIAAPGSEGGRGVHGTGPAEHDKRPRIGGGHSPGSAGKTGVHVDVPDGHRPQLADAYSRGRGVHNDNHLSQQVPRQVHPNESGAGGLPGVLGLSGGGTCEQRRAWLAEWFSRLRDRLRTVRVCCGHWKRVCDSESVTTRLGTTGVFLDPPYPTHAADGSESRAAGLYATDGGRDALDALRDEVLAWCRGRGPDPRMRIVVAGYDTDGYALLVKEGWEEILWRAQGGYGNRSAKGRANAGRERLWCSPGCNRPREPSLFDHLED
jgi:hypothetical protein